MTESAESRFHAFNFEGDERWRWYRGKVNMSPTLTAAEEQNCWERVKRRWYREHVDGSLSTNAPEPQPQPQPEREEPTPSAQGATSSSTGPTGVTRWRMYILLCCHLFILLSVLLYVVPLAGGHFAYASYYRALKIALAVYVFTWTLKYQWPGRNRALWMRALADDDTHYAMLCVILMARSPFILTVLPIATFSLFFVASVGGNFLATYAPGMSRVVGPTFSKILSMQDRALSMIAIHEITTGFALIFNLFVRGELLTTFLFWHFLKLRYTTKMHSRQAWGAIDGYFRAKLPTSGILRTFYNKISGFLHHMAGGRTI